MLQETMKLGKVTRLNSVATYVYYCAMLQETMKLGKVTWIKRVVT